MTLAPKKMTVFWKNLVKTKKRRSAEGKARYFQLSEEKLDDGCEMKTKSEEEQLFGNGFCGD